MAAWIRFLIARLFAALATLWAVFTVSFFLMRAAPGGPFDREREAPAEIQQALARRYALDRPVIEQYFSELARVAALDFGRSYRLVDSSVAEIIAHGLPISAALGILSLSLAIVLGVPSGIAAALRRGWTDRGLMTAAALFIATPNFVLAGGMVLVFSFLIPVLPPAGWGRPSQMVLPALCLAAPFAASIARIARTSMLETWRQDYIRTAIAKGLPHRDVVWRHALPAAILPVISFLGPATAGILTGSLVVEQIFAIPGLGSSFVTSAINRDYTLAMGLVLLYTAFLLATSVLVDLAYRMIDPRMSSSP